MTTPTDSTNSARWTLIDAIERLDCAGLDSSELQAQLDALDTPERLPFWHADNALAPSTDPGMVRIAYRLDGDRQQRGIWRAVDVPVGRYGAEGASDICDGDFESISVLVESQHGDSYAMEDAYVIGAVSRPVAQSTSDICDEAAAMFDRLMHQNADCPHGTGDKFAHMADVMLSLSLALRDVEPHVGDIDHVVEAYMCDSALQSLSDEGLHLLDPKWDDVEALTITDRSDFVPKPGTDNHWHVVSPGAEFAYVVSDCEDSVAEAIASKTGHDATDIACRIRDYRAGGAVAGLLRML